MKRRRGRPRLPSKDRKSALLAVRLTQAEMKRVRDRAKAEGVEVWDWVRRRLLEG